MEKDKERHQLELRKLQQQVSSLTQTIQRNESVIIMLKQQLATKQKIEEVSFKHEIVCRQRIICLPILLRRQFQDRIATTV